MARWWLLLPVLVLDLVYYLAFNTYHLTGGKLRFKESATPEQSGSSEDEVAETEQEVVGEETSSGHLVRCVVSPAIVLIVTFYSASSALNPILYPV